MAIRIEKLGPDLVLTDAEVYLIARVFQDNGDSLPVGTFKAGLARHLIYPGVGFTTTWYKRSTATWGIGAPSSMDQLEFFDVTASVSEFATLPDSEKLYAVLMPIPGVTAGHYSLICGHTATDAVLTAPITVEQDYAVKLSNIHAALLNDQLIDDATKTLHIRNITNTANMFSFALKDAQGLPSIREVMRKERV